MKQFDLEFKKLLLKKTLEIAEKQDSNIYGDFFLKQAQQLEDQISKHLKGISDEKAKNSNKRPKRKSSNSKSKPTKSKSSKRVSRRKTN